MISYAFIDGFTRLSRARAIEHLKLAVAEAGGIILDFDLQGVAALQLTVELGAGAVAALQARLEGAGIELFSSSAADLEEAKGMAPGHAIVAMIHLGLLAAEATISSVPEGAC